MPNEAAELRSPARADRDVVAREDVDRIVDGGDVAGRIHIDDRGGTEGLGVEADAFRGDVARLVDDIEAGAEIADGDAEAAPAGGDDAERAGRAVECDGPADAEDEDAGTLEFGAMLVVSVLMSKVSRGGPRATPSDLVTGAGDVRGADAGAGIWPGWVDGIMASANAPAAAERKAPRAGRPGPRVYLSADA
jgi:hypothetical protein